jgi:hypothetical protein
MPRAAEQVIEFYGGLFERIFIAGGEVDRLERLRARAVRRQVEEAAGAADADALLFAPAVCGWRCAWRAGYVGAAYGTGGPGAGRTSGAYVWLANYSERVDVPLLLNRIERVADATFWQASELIAILCRTGEDDTLLRISWIPELYRIEGPFGFHVADIALLASYDVDARAGKTPVLVQGLRATSFPESLVLSSSTAALPYSQEDRRALT